MINWLWSKSVITTKSLLMMLNTLKSKNSSSTIINIIMITVMSNMVTTIRATKRVWMIKILCWISIKLFKWEIKTQPKIIWIKHLRIVWKIDLVLSQVTLPSNKTSCKKRNHKVMLCNLRNLLVKGLSAN